jgi:hypothetical protein
MMISKDQSIVTQVAAKIASELTGNTQTDGNLESIQECFLSHFDFVRTAILDAHEYETPASTPTQAPTPWPVQANESNVVETFNASYESAGGSLRVAGVQHGPLPAWLIDACSKAGVTEVWDNRDTANAQNRRPLFKAADGKKNAKGQELAFWPPKG